MNPFHKRLAYETPLIASGVLATLLRPVNATDISAAEHPYLTQMRKQLTPKVEMTDDGIAILPIQGVLARKPDPFEMLFYGVEDSDAILQMVQGAANNPAVKAMLLDVDSPGGFILGGPEVADAVRAARKQKPVATWTGGLMASLAYWIGSQAGTVVASRSAIVGSIGAFTTHVDYSAWLAEQGISVEVIRNEGGDLKAAGVMGTALTSAQRANLQDQINTSFGEFRSAVKSARPSVTDDSMRGQIFNHAALAKQAGLVDSIGDRNSAIELLRKSIRTPNGVSANQAGTKAQTFTQRIMANGGVKACNLKSEIAKQEGFLKTAVAKGWVASVKAIEGKIQTAKSQLAALGS